MTMIEKYLEIHRRKVRGHESAPIRPGVQAARSASAMAGLEPVERVFLEGTSPVSLGHLTLRTVEEANEFLRSYGIDPECPIERLKMEEIHREAVDFLRRLLCPAPRACDATLTMPPEVEDPSNITRFLIGASTMSQHQPLQAWACAVLRVMHAITYANQLSVGPHSAEIRRQILDRFRSRVHTDENGQLWLGRESDRVPLCSIQYREEKARDSVILKLLHKPDNLPQSVHDRVGVRMVTPGKREALQVLQYLARHHLANVAHLTPGRSRNTLLTEDWEKSAGAGNPHSSPDFRSLQFTCRQLIRLDNPMYAATRKIRKALQESPCRDLEVALSELEGHAAQPYIRFLFPYEIQILDQENDLKSQIGESSHSNYRQRQLRAVRHRVFPAGLLAH
ncbi:MAG: TIGR04552 family protein [Candidatus Eremiobacteraeota bacterium]|nr:TIGR04552 family protein [Candidatus Eremiobacteraeota bacterium]